MKEIRIGLGESGYTSNGAKVSVEIIDPLSISNNPSNTAIHESLHAVTAGEKVKKVSIVPGLGYLGITELDSFDAAAAAAPHAFGMSGTGHDEVLVEYSGVSISSADSSAKSKLQGKERHVMSVAGYLENKKTITGNQVKRVMDRVDKGENVFVKIEKPDGDEDSYTLNGVKEEIIMVEDVEYQLIPEELATP